PAEGNDSARLKKFFDLYWAARMREMPDLAAAIGASAVEGQLPDFSPEMFALTHRLSHLELAALSSIDRARLTPAEQLSYDLALQSMIDRLQIGLTDDPLKNPLLEPFQHMPDSDPAAERERLLRVAADVVRQHVAPALRTLRDYLANEYVPHARESIAISDLP